MPALNGTMNLYVNGSERNLPKRGLLLNYNAKYKQWISNIELINHIRENNIFGFKILKNKSKNRTNRQIIIMQVNGHLLG